MGRRSEPKQFPEKSEIKRFSGKQWRYFTFRLFNSPLSFVPQGNRSKVSHWGNEDVARRFQSTLAKSTRTKPLATRSSIFAQVSNSVIQKKKIDRFWSDRF